MSLIEKLKKSSKSEYTSILSESIFFNDTEPVTTPVPMINVALSGQLDGGITPGWTVLAGQSRSFKSGFSLLMAATYIKKYEDAALIFYDSEFGAPQSYFKGFGIDTDRVLHTPITNIEELKFDIMGQLADIERKDKVIIIIDSLGNVASKKEVEDALNEKSVADMTRAKAMKSLFRMVTPNLRLKDIPVFAVAHTYKDNSAFFPTDIVGGGTGIMFGADNLWIIGRQQDKVGTEIQGYHFVIKVEKSRYVKEKSKIPISVSFNGGIMKWSGLLECGLESGWIKKPKNGWYALYESPDDSEPIGKMVRAKDTQNSAFWGPLLTNPAFAKWIENRYALATDEKLILDGNEQTTEEEVEDDD